MIVEIAFHGSKSPFTLRRNMHSSLFDHNWIPLEFALQTIES